MGKKKEYAFSLPLLEFFVHNYRKTKKHIPPVNRVSAWE
jgi:hypothetical protein